MKTKLGVLCGLAVLLVWAVPAQAAEREWAFTFAGSVYVTPDHTFFNPVVTADRSRLHLEARYNYEDLDTASAFAGYNLTTGRTVEMNFTPIVGGVFGQSNGIAPGFLLEVNYWKLSFTSQAEYLFSTDDQDSSFFYAWSELTYSPADWIWFGAAGQRTRLYHSELDIQRGLLLGLGAGNFSVTGYLMNPDDAEARTGIVTAALEF